MATRQVTHAAMQQAVNAIAQHGLVGAGKVLGIPHQTLDHRRRMAAQAGIKPDASGLDPAKLTEQEMLGLRDRVRELETILKAERRERLSEDKMREAIVGVAAMPLDVPKWTLESRKKSGRSGIPTLFLSDLHWGEVVAPGQIHSLNEYNVSIAKRRLQRVISRAMTLCFEHMTSPDYPGIVLALGGDLVSGDIHEELSETNELTSGETLIDIVGALTWAIDRLLEKFPEVYVPGVAGNHGRMHKKPRAKNRAFTNFDWIICQLLRKHFAKERRVKWLIPDGPDAWYRIYSHRYLLTHGDQFRGGDGIIGALGPIMRGQVRKMARNSNIGLEFDTMLIGHWHQWMALRRVIVNGSLKGYDEYAAQNNFAYEPPIQGLWFTHPTRGITATWPIHGEEPGRRFEGASVQLGEMPS